MEKMEQEQFIAILKKELVPALGCTEPISVAFAAAKARQVLGEFPKHIDIRCSGNIIKNVKGVMVPNSGGMKGIDVAAILGTVGGNADLELRVLENITDDDRAKTKELLKEGFCSCQLHPNVENLYIVATAVSEKHTASVKVVNRHTLITEIKKDDEIIFEQIIQSEKKDIGEDWNLSIAKIIEFANTVDIKAVKDTLDSQIENNTRISEEGLNNAYGEQVGRILLNEYGNDVRTRARAKAAAGSDARMGGCGLPVVINSGSGNQGLTVSMPVLEYVKEWNCSEEQKYRALLVSNLVSIHLKHYIGSLSAFCGAVTAACGTGAAITYLAGGTYAEISNTITNTLANVGGIVCDGAKSSCAAKIASAVEAAILGHHMSMAHRAFKGGDGIVQPDIEETIKSIGYIGRVGMKQTDEEILKIMLNQVEL